MPILVVYTSTGNADARPPGSPAQPNWIATVDATDRSGGAVRGRVDPGARPRCAGPPAVRSSWSGLHVHVSRRPDRLVRGDVTRPRLRRRLPVRCPRGDGRRLRGRTL